MQCMCSLHLKRVTNGHRAYQAFCIRQKAVLQAIPDNVFLLKSLPAVCMLLAMGIIMLGHVCSCILTMMLCQEHHLCLSGLGYAGGI